MMKQQSERSRMAQIPQPMQTMQPARSAQPTLTAQRASSVQLVNDARRIGVLALQGAFTEHCAVLAKMGAEPFEIRALSDIRVEMDGLVLPGGESTTQGKLLRELGLLVPLQRLIADGLPVYGTCAGLILLAREIANDRRCHLGLMDITAQRNAYGRQLGSFCTEGEYDGKLIPMSFIRAPYIAEAGPDVEVLSTVEGKIVAARQDNMMVTAFHPEVTEDLTVHRYFLDLVERHRSDSETNAEQKPWLQ